jgi:hypothetical protein
MSIADTLTTDSMKAKFLGDSAALTAPCPLTSMACNVNSPREMIPKLPILEVFNAMRNLKTKEIKALLVKDSTKLEALFSKFAP